MLMRWVFLICLLLNGALLLRYALLQNPEIEPVAVTESKPQIQLLSEVAPSLLKSLENPRLTGDCAFISNIEWLADAERIGLYLSEAGYRAERQQFSEEAVAGYALEMAAPSDALARLEVLELLDRYGVVPETRQDNSGTRFLLGSFASHEEADLLKARLEELGDSMVIRAEMRQIARYQLRILLPSGRDLSSEIKAVLRKSYKLIKIEKKPCLGVASTQVAG